jgi:hypothetical protein
MVQPCFQYTALYSIQEFAHPPIGEDPTVQWWGRMGRGDTGTPGHWYLVFIYNKLEGNHHKLAGA